MAEIYSNAPLIEAVFEIRFPAELSIKTHTDDFYNKIKTDFPLIGTHPFGSPHLYDFRSQEGTRIVKVGLDKISFHAHKYNGGFSEFQENALKYTQLFINTYKIEKLARTGLRYINYIPFVRIEGCIPIEKYINFGYAIKSDSIPNRFEALHTILLVKVGSGNIQILVQSKEIENVIKSEVLVLDFDYFLKDELRADNIIHYISESHTHTKKIFEDLITEDYRKAMRGADES